MRIKRFIASDMRTALRMVRDEQGPDAVILSNRPCAEGVEVVSATDYDEALVHQALRAAAPAIAATPAAAPTPAAVAAVAAEPTPAPASVPAFAATNPAPSVRETLATRARAVFKLGDAPRAPSAEPTLAELTADTTPAAAAVASAEPTRFDAMMAALGAVPASVADAEPANDVVTLSHAARAQAEAAGEPTLAELMTHAAPAAVPAVPAAATPSPAPVATASIATSATGAGAGVLPATGG